MDGLPNDVLARIFSHLPTLDLGRMMSVSRSWNTLLSTSPKLWINVEILEQISFQKVHQTIVTSSARSRSTLSTIYYPYPLHDYEIAETMRLLDSSRATIRRVILDFSQVELSKSLFGQPCPMDFFLACSKLEELYLSDSHKGGGSVKTTPGILTHFSCQAIGKLSDAQYLRFSKLKFLEVVSVWVSADFFAVLSSCTLLEDLRFGDISGCTVAEGLQKVMEESIFNIRILHVRGRFHDCCWTFDGLEELSFDPTFQSTFKPLKRLSRLHLQLPSFDEGEVEDHRLETLSSAIKAIDSYQETLEVLELGTRDKGEDSNYTVDQVLEFLRVNLVLGAPCPNLKELHLEEEISFNPELLAQILLSRRLLSKGHSILTPLDVKTKYHFCSDLILYLHEDQHERFRAAELEVFASCSEWMRKAAGRATLRLLD